MRPWQRKAIVDAGKSLLPFQTALRRIKRRVFPYVTDGDNDLDLIRDAALQVKEITDLGIGLSDAAVVEIGTGWNPILPLMFAFCGAGTVTTVDQERLLDPRLVRLALTLLAGHEARIHSILGRGDVFKIPHDWARKNEARIDDCLAGFGIGYRAPCPFAALPAASADIIISRDVLEHIAEDMLAGIFDHSRRILRPGGVVCHSIDMTDHWEHQDKSISRVNFLKYDGWLWRLAGVNPQNFQNRLRRFEYLALLERHGFDVLFANGTFDPVALDSLRSLPLCERYAGVAHEELAVLHSTVIARLRS